MPRIDDIFARHRSEGRTALCPFVTAGYPSLECTAEAVVALEEVLGPTVVELGIPFSDPIADGPVIAASMHQALESGVTPARVFETVRRVRPHTGHGLVAMVSASIVQRMEPGRFMTEAAGAGFDGVIVPDLDVAGEGDGDVVRLGELAASSGLCFILLVSPTTPADRVGWIAARCTGFLYLLARVGITGEQEALPDVSPRVAALRRVTDLPLAVGFGISRPEHVAVATAAADAAIVGSAIVRRMGEAARPAAAAAGFCRELAAGLSSRGPGHGGGTPPKGPGDAGSKSPAMRGGRTP